MSLDKLEAQLIEHYGPFIGNTGGNDIAELLKGRTPMQINAPLAFIENSVQSQMSLLRKLHDAGLLRTPEEAKKEK